MLIKELKRLVFPIWKINSSALANHFKWILNNTYLSTFILNRYDLRNKVADIAGYKVKFCTFNSLRKLFISIFVNQEYFFSADTKNPFIIDCGSNIGMSILYFKMLYPESQVLAFEPNSEAFICLERNIGQNNLKSTVPYQKALSNKEGTIDFYYDKDNPGSLWMSMVRARMPKQKETVPCTLLSKYIDREVDFLKIDVEGAEEDIIEDLRCEDKLRYIKQMVIEYHHHILHDADLFSHMLRTLEDADFGYQIESSLDRPLKSGEFQDILVYAYKKNPIT